MFVTDTHSFLWFLTDDKRLGEKAKELFEVCDQGREIIVIPSIVLIESLFICEDKRIDLEFHKVLEKIQNTFNYPVYPLDFEIVMECENLKQLKEPHDRIIVATSKLLNCPVITKDDKIKNSNLVETIW